MGGKNTLALKDADGPAAASSEGIECRIEFCLRSSECNSGAWNYSKFLNIQLKYHSYRTLLVSKSDFWPLKKQIYVSCSWWAIKEKFCIKLYILIILCDGDPLLSEWILVKASHTLATRVVDRSLSVHHIEWFISKLMI